MIKLLITHFLYEKAINTLFEKLQLNFTKVFPMPNKDDHIEIKYYQSNTNDKMWVKNAKVHSTNENALVISYTQWNATQDKMPVAQFKIELVLKENIIQWHKANNNHEYPFKREQLYT